MKVITKSITDITMIIYECIIIISLVTAIVKMTKNKKQNIQDQTRQNNQTKQKHLDQQLRNDTRR